MLGDVKLVLLVENPTLINKRLAAASLCFAKWRAVSGSVKDGSGSTHFRLPGDMNNESLSTLTGFQMVCHFKLEFGSVILSSRKVSTNPVDRFSYPEENPNRKATQICTSLARIKINDGVIASGKRGRD